MILKLSSGIKIDLPTEYNTEERVDLVNQILTDYPLEFVYNGDDMFTAKFNSKVDNNKLVKIKLDILATYIIRAEEKYSKNILSRYKETKRPLQELPFSQFKEEVQDMKGWY